MNWKRTRLALRRWSCKDLGDIQLVLERAAEGSPGSVWEEDVQKPPEEAADARPMARGMGGGEVKVDLDFEPFLYAALGLVGLLLVGYVCF